MARFPGLAVSRPDMASYGSGSLMRSVVGERRTSGTEAALESGGEWLGDRRVSMQDGTPGWPPTVTRYIRSPLLVTRHGPTSACKRSLLTTRTSSQAFGGLLKKYDGRGRSFSLTCGGRNSLLPCCLIPDNL